MEEVMYTEEPYELGEPAPYDDADMWKEPIEKLAKISFENWQRKTEYVYEGIWEEQPESIKNAHRSVVVSTDKETGK